MALPQYQDQHHPSGADGGAFVDQPIGQPVTFTTGQFAQRTMRVELEELQKADSGRKYAKVDRRPLDPPPTILLRIFDVRNLGTDKVREEEVDDYEEVKNNGILCTVDLFPVPDKVLDDNIQVPGSTSASEIPDFAAYPPSQAPSTTPSPGAKAMNPRAPGVPLPHTSPFELTNTGALKLNYSSSINPNENIFTYFPLHPFTTSATESHAPPRVLPFQIPRRQPMLGQLNEDEPPSDIVLRIGNHLVTESSKLTPALVGEKFAEPALIVYEGKKRLMFVFGNLAVRREGTFIFRYKVFDIFSSTSEGQDRPILAELYGGPFRVYSTREFPGLERSTELTRKLSKSGVRVPLRDAERKSRRGGGSGRDQT